MIGLEPNPVLPVQRVHVFPRSGNIWLNGKLLPSQVVISSQGYVTKGVDLKEVDQHLRMMVLRPGIHKVVLYVFGTKRGRKGSKRVEYTPEGKRVQPMEGEA